MSRVARIALGLAATLTLAIGMSAGALGAPVTIKTPVLLVPGLTSETGLWSSWLDGARTVAVNEDGFKLLAPVRSDSESDVFGAGVPVYALERTWGEGALGDIPRAARAVPWAIDMILQEHPEHEQVFVVTHSTGGLLARYYLESLLPAGPTSRKYKGDIAGLVSLDPPQQGWDYSGAAIARDLYGPQLASVADTQVVGGSAVASALAAGAIPKDPRYSLVAGNYYPLLGDGVFTLQEQLPTATPGGGPARVTVVDAPHDTKVAAWYESQAVRAGFPATAKTSLLPAGAESVDARKVVRATFDAVATGFQEGEVAATAAVPKAVSPPAHLNPVHGASDTETGLLEWVQAEVKMNDYDFHPKSYTVESMHFASMGRMLWAVGVIVPEVKPNITIDHPLPFIAKRVGTRWRLVAAGYPLTAEMYPDVPESLWGQIKY